MSGVRSQQPPVVAENVPVAVPAADELAMGGA
jgi:hypothetical protein